MSDVRLIAKSGRADSADTPVETQSEEAPQESGDSYVADSGCRWVCIDVPGRHIPKCFLQCHGTSAAEVYKK